MQSKKLLIKVLTFLTIWIYSTL